MKLIEEKVLVECLDLLEAGESVESILARYPHLADALRPFLNTAVHLSQHAKQPSLHAMHHSRKRMLQQAKAIKKPSPKVRWRQWQRTLMPLASTLMVLLVVGISLVAASTTAVPGDALYDAKRLFEDIRLNRATEPESIEVVWTEIREERVREVEAVLRTDRDVPITFEGTIEAISANQWQVAGIQVLVDKFTRIEGSVEVGAWALVNGRTHDGILRATSIAISSTTPPGGESDETVIPSPEAAPSPTPTAAPENNNGSTNDNANDNADDNDDVNDNTDDDESNTNDNANDNGSDNGDDDNVNNNDNTNDNTGGNDNANDNGNGNGNANDNANDNTGGNDNGNNNDNANDNTGGNDNANNNDNGNDNTGGSNNDNANDNTGGSNNDNANDNTGGDANGNDNNNDNDNNDNANDDNDNSGGSGSGNSGSGGNRNDNGNDNDQP